ncbi:tetratricopeptide repeat protein [Hymenobacter monticola]|uniref:Tetratricopeptide repeat protein n=1 Tax=Hymenobacter monticola TaxID=1705399 RepID=A0ABY4B2M6_9BACT|nr:tetratricopeptide repeat protein [Hymenobacter monticola]UOE33393.1 tetratricopeptide repeat protein [Hymenobacter monticola]
MKYWVLAALLLSGPGLQLLTRVRDRNEAVATGTAAYRRGETALAVYAFENALNAKARRPADPRLLLNLAHAQTRAGMLVPAQATYERLLTGSPAALSSVARQQLAVQAARQGKLAQAIGLLRQALILNPGNAGARYDYEVLIEYLGKRPNAPKIPPPPTPKEKNAADEKAAPEKNGTAQNQPAEKAGTDRQGEVNDSKPSPVPPTGPPDSRPDPAGQPDQRQPSAAPASAAAGGRTLGNGTRQPLPSGEEPGQQRGLDRSAGASSPTANGRSNHPGTEAATPADVQLQTQRERLQAMNLSPAQARQLLETLRAQEQQYLQQLARPPAQKPNPNKPTW